MSGWQKHLLGGLCWLLICVQPALSDGHKTDELTDAYFNQGVQAVRDEDYFTAITIFTAFAEAMQADAQYSLAILLKSGKGQPQNFQQALIWAWLAHLGNEDRAADLARDLLKLLDEEAIEAARASVFGSLQSLIDTGDSNAIIKMARYYQEIVSEPEPEEIYIWYAIAAALNLEGGFEARDEAYENLDGDAEIVALQTEANKRFNAFVAR